MNNALIFPAIICIIFAIMMLTMFGGNITRYFHLVDKRSFLTKESWQRVNVLMANGDFSMYASDGMDGKRWNRISVGYERSKGESVSKSFNGDDINLMVEQAYAWALNEGYLVRAEFVPPTYQNEKSN